MSLEHYGIRVRQAEAGIPLDQLLDKERLTSIIRHYAQRIHTDDMTIAGSLFMKRYAVLTAAAAVYYYDLQEEKMDWWTSAQFDAEHFTLLIDESISELVDDSWRARIFREHLTPMLELIAKECKINERILWENIAVRINSVFREYEHTMPSELLDKTYSVLTSKPCNWLGREQNPFAAIIHRTFNDKANPKRKTCCRYYQISTSTETPYCYVCPLWK